jgi:hypothetical protein
VVASFDVILERVLDMIDGTTRRSLGFSLTRLWREMQDRGEEAINRAVGSSARDLLGDGIP